MTTTSLLVLASSLVVLRACSLLTVFLSIQTGDEEWLYRDSDPLSVTMILWYVTFRLFSVLTR